LPTAKLIIVGKNNTRVGMFLVSFDDFGGVGLIVNIILVSDGDEGGLARMNSKVEITADVSMSAFDDFEMVFLSERFDMIIGGGGGNKNLGWVGLIEGGFNAGFKMRAFLVG